MVVHYKGRSIPLENGETVLNGLLRSGFDVSFGCRSGVCGSCKLQATAKSEIPAAAQASLSGIEKSKNYFLPCSCRPEKEISIVDTNEVKTLPGKIIAKSMISRSVLRLKVKADINFSAGQYINVWKNSQQCRSYSIANVPCEKGCLELHIKLHPDGLFSQWFKIELNIGDSIFLSPPMGDCIYSSQPNMPLLLAGMSTGLAPLVGILYDALDQNHTAPIHLISAANDAEDLYFVDSLRSLSKAHSNLKLDFIARVNGCARAGVRVTDVYQFIKEQYPSTKELVAYVCGGENFVRKLKKQVFLAGAEMNNIHSDVFLPSSPMEVTKAS